VQQRLERIRHGVEQGALDRAVAPLLRVQVRGVGRPPFPRVGVGVGRQERGDRLRPLGREPVPDDAQGTAAPPSEGAQRDEDLLAGDGAPEVTGAPAGRPVQRGDQGDAARALAAPAEAFQEGRVADGGPGGPEAGPKRVPRLVPEGDGAPAAANPLLIRGQARASQAARRASSRSLARGSSRGGLQPRARSARLPEAG
jgi:hypothetical protein